MKAQYAAAIRFGIMTAREIVFTPEMSTFYSERSKAIGYSFMDSHRCNELAQTAFDRAWKQHVKKLKDTMTPSEYLAARQAHERAWELHTETRTERDARLTLERVEKLEARLRTLESHQNDHPAGAPADELKGNPHV